MDTAQEVIARLGLEPHPEGGYFRRTCASEREAPLGPEGEHRKLYSSIYYLLTRQSPVGRLHVNCSDILHCFHLGSPLVYTLISPEGELHSATLGPDLAKGHQLQLLVPGGWWKGSQLVSGEYGLISEAVSPGFEAEDMRFVSREEASASFPQLVAAIPPALFGEGLA